MKKILLFITLIISSAFSIAQTTSDTCADANNATAIVADTVYTVDIVDGTEIPNTFCEGNATNVTVAEWVKYTATDDAFITVSTDLPQNSGGDTRLNIYSGTCGSLACEGGDDDSGSGYLSVATFEAQAGTTYFIVFDDRWSEDGFDFQLTESDPPEAAPVEFVTQGISTSGTNRAIVDMNGDHLDDIVSVSNNNINIKEQQSSGGFQTRNFATTYANNSPSWSLAAADYNADGFTDLLYGGGSGVTIMTSNNSDGNDTVDGYTEYSGGQYVFSQRSNFADINNDGHLDAFVCHDVEPNVYYLNDGSGNLTFYQGQDPQGISSGLGLYASGGNYGSVWIDYDNDRNLDMFIAKCGGETARRMNQMHKNNGDNTYSEVAATIGLADPMQTWSSAWGDFDNDGDMDVFVGASSGSHKLMRNDLTTDGSGLNTSNFVNVTAASGVSLLSDTGIENVTYDFDNDGNLDIASNGNILFGNGDMTFSLFTNVLSSSNGSFGDLDNDGFIDAFIGDTMYMNQGNNNNWLSICTIGSDGGSNINGIGARVEIHTPSGVQIRDVRSGEGFRYMSTLNTHFGLGTEDTIDNLIIYWPSGTVDNISNPSINQRICVTEGQTLTVENQEVSDLVIYPNPTSNVLNFSATASLNGQIATVFDVTGKKVLNKKLDTNTLDVSNLPSGFYIVRLETKGRSINRKFIKN